MNKIFFLILPLFFYNCTLNKVVHHHGIHNLEIKQSKLKVNFTNKNDIAKIIGPPSVKSSFDNDVYIFLERKTSSSRLTKLGKKELLINNVLVLEIDSKGMLISKSLYNKDDMKKIKFDKSFTETNYSKNSFIYNFLYSLRQKIDDPLGKKRVKTGTSPF
jgi:outer membrane protein assembly factor BamE (lipoprotein component of BamABCDE complex)